MDLPHLTSADVIPDQPLTPEEATRQANRRRLFRRIAVILTTLVVLFAIIGFVTTRHWLRQTMHDSLPQLDGSLSIPGLSAPVTIQRDTHGVPHISATSSSATPPASTPPSTSSAHTSRSSSASSAINPSPGRPATASSSASSCFRTSPRASPPNSAAKPSPHVSPSTSSTTFTP